MSYSIWGMCIIVYYYDFSVSCHLLLLLSCLQDTYCLFQLKEDLAFLTDDSVPVKKPKLESSSESKLNTWKERDASSKERERLRDSHRDLKESEDKEVHKPTLKEDPSWLDIGLEIKLKKSSDPTEKRYIIGKIILFPLCRKFLFQCRVLLQNPYLSYFIRILIVHC